MTAPLCAQAEPQGSTAQPRLQPPGTQLPAVWAEPDTNSIAQSSNRIRGWLCCPSSSVHLEMRGTASLLAAWEQTEAAPCSFLHSRALPRCPSARTRRALNKTFIYTYSTLKTHLAGTLGHTSSTLGT